MSPESLPLPDLSNTALLFVRVGAALRLAPFFGGLPLGRLAWAAISIALACLLVPDGRPPAPAEIGGLYWLGLAARELLVGVLIGLMARIAFSVLEVTGGLSRVVTLSLPDTGQERLGHGAPLATAYALVGTAVFLLVGGHHAFIIGLKSTVDCLPPGSPFVTEGVAAAARPRILALVGSAMGAGVLLSAPAFAAGVSSELFVGLLGRLGLGSGFAAAEGGQPLRALLAQLLVIAAFAAVVAGAVAFLMAAVERTAICS